MAVRAGSVLAVAVFLPHVTMAVAMLAMLVGFDSGVPPILAAPALVAIGALALFDRRHRAHAAGRALGLLLAALMEVKTLAGSTTVPDAPGGMHGHELGVVALAGLVVGAAYLTLAIAAVRTDARKGAMLGHGVLSLVMPTVMIGMLLFHS